MEHFCVRERTIHYNHKNSIMKYYTIIAIGLFLLFAGCQTGTIKVERDFLSNQTEGWNITVERPVFFSQNVTLQKSCTAVNDRVTELIDSLQNDLKVQLGEYMQKAEEMKVQPMIPFVLDVKDSVFLANHRYISVRLSAYTLTGGANGLTVYYAFNYDIQDQRFLTLKEILDYNKSAEIDQQIKVNFRNPDNCFSEIPTLAKVTVVNFTENDFCFTYNPLVLGAHYCGFGEVSVPRMVLKGAFFK